jgi:hypothetical protein
MARIAVGCRCRIKARGQWKEFWGQECIITERSGQDFGFIPLEQNPEMEMGGSVEYDQCAWIQEDQLELLDMNFDKNLPFIDWVEQYEYE